MEQAHPKTTPRDFFLYFLAIITLYISVWRYIDLLFEYINYIFPDQLEWYFMGLSESVRWSISSLVIVFPVYILVTWYLRKDAIAHPEKRDLRVRKWLLNFTLFLAAVTIIVDLVALLNRFLDGDLTTRFILKVFVVLIVAGSVFAYYFWDLRRDTLPGSKPSRLLLIIASTAMLASIVSGFFIIGSPMTQRKVRFDDRRVMDLQNIQWQVINYWQAKEQLPSTLEDLKNDISGYAAPKDPERGEVYEYKVIASQKFELCATFNLPTRKPEARSGSYPYAPYPAEGENWTHAEGRVCFSRMIDPDQYPPLKIAPRVLY